MLSPMNALTPRNRQEVEPFRLLKTRRLIGVTPLGLTVTNLATARDNAFFVVEALWGANVTAADETYSLHIVTGMEPAAAGNAIAYSVSIPANTTLAIVGGAGMALAPNQSLVAVCSVAGGMNIYGHGWDMMGDMQTS